MKRTLLLFLALLFCFCEGWEDEKTHFAINGLPEFDNISDSKRQFEVEFQTGHEGKADKRKITVTGKGHVVATPDTAELHIESGMNHETASQAKILLENRIIEVIKNWTDLGIFPDNITHFELRVLKQNEWNQGLATFHHFEARQALNVRVDLESVPNELLRQYPSVNQVIEVLYNGTGDTFQLTQMGLTIRNPKPHEYEAQRRAVSDAIHTANSIVESMNMRLGLPHDIMVEPFRPDLDRTVISKTNSRKFSDGSLTTGSLTSSVANAGIAFEATVRITFDLVVPSQSLLSSLLAST